MKDTFLKPLLIIALAASAGAALILASHFPIFTDEVGYLASYGRGFLDGAVRPSFLPECSNGGRGVETPAALLPGLLIDSVLLGSVSSPQELRYTGIMLFCIWLGQCFLLRKLAFGKAFDRTGLLAAFIPLSGNLPFLLTLARPELLLAIGINVALIAAFLPRRLSLPRELFRQICIWLLPSYLLCTHPKAVFWTPVLLLAAHCSMRSRILKALYLVWTLIAVAAAARFYQFYLSCPEVPAVESGIQALNILPRLLMGELSAAGDSVRNIARLIEGLFVDTAFFRGGWSGADKMFSSPPILLSFGALAGLTGILLHSIRLAGNFCLRRWNPENSARALPLLVIGCFGVYAMTQNLYQFYYSAFPGFLLISMFFCSYSGEGSAFLDRMVMTCLTIAAALVPVQYLWISAHGGLSPNGELWRNSTGAPQFFADATQSRGENPEIREAAAQCGLKLPNPATRLILDEATYFAGKISRRPVLSQYIWGLFDYPGPSFERLSRDLDFDGLITRCDRLPDSMQRRATATGRFCCIGFRR